MATRGPGTESPRSGGLLIVRPSPLPPCLFFLLIWGLGSGLSAQVELPTAKGGFPYQLSLDREEVRVGELLTVVLEVEGLGRARLRSLFLDPGLSLEASFLHPLVLGEGRRGTELRLELRILQPGKRRVERLRLEGEEGSLDLGPFSFEALPEKSEGVSIRPYRWVFPETVYRYQAFSLRLVGAEGPVSETALATFPLPAGLSIESGTGPLSWIATALNEGSLLLPAAEISGEEAGRAPARSLRVLPLPAELEQSRAIGDFSLELQVPEGGRVGERLFFRLLLSGRGNQPSVRFPGVRLSLEDRPLPGAALATRRSEALRVGTAGYEGSSILEFSVLPTEPGLLRISVEALTTLDPAAGLRVLRTESRTLGISAGGSTTETGIKASRLRGLAVDAASRLARKLDTASRAPILLEAGNYPELLDLVSSLPAGLFPRDRAILEAATRWELGDKAAALALLLAQVRRAAFPGELRRAASELSASLGAGPPLLDALPSPVLMLILGLVPACLGGVGLFLGLRRGRKEGEPTRGRGGPLVLRLVLLIVVLLGLALCLASLRERRTEYGVVWTDRLLAIPSDKAEGGIGLVPGQCGRLIGEAPGYRGLRFPDGTVGWAPLESVYSY